VGGVSRCEIARPVCWSYVRSACEGLADRARRVEQGRALLSVASNVIEGFLGRSCPRSEAVQSPVGEVSGCMVMSSVAGTLGWAWCCGVSQRNVALL